MHRFNVTFSPGDKGRMTGAAVSCTTGAAGFTITGFGFAAGFTITGFGFVTTTGGAGLRFSRKERSRATASR